MKNWLCILFVLLLSGINAQSIKISLLKQPCFKDGEVKIEAIGFQNNPLMLHFNYNEKSISKKMNGNVEIINDYNGAQLTVNIFDPITNQGAYEVFTAPAFTYDRMVTDAICPSKGKIEVINIVGGSGPYTYVLKDYGGRPLTISHPFIVDEGLYYLEVKDAKGCLGINTSNRDSIENALQVRNISSIQATLDVKGANCTDGRISAINFSGGIPPYSFQWNNGSLNSTISNLKTGNYTVTIYDAIGCKNEFRTFVPQLTTIDVNAVIKPSACSNNDGEIQAFGSGGVPPYTYIWDNNSKQSKISNLSAGSYIVTVLDSRGCVGSKFYYVNTSSPIKVFYDQTPSSCLMNDGELSLQISGGTLPYNIVWNTIPVKNGAKITKLIAGNYTYKITDAKGCTSSGTATVLQKNQINVYSTIIPEQCKLSDGKIDVTAYNGIPPYSYKWNNGSTSQSISNLNSGFYNLSVTDAEGCNVIQKFYLPKSSSLKTSIRSVSASCLYSKDGSLQANVIGGAAPIKYQWSNGLTSNLISGLNSDHYNLTIEDGNGCIDYKSVYLDYDATADYCFCTIMGKVFQDLNNNCAMDQGEPGIENMQIHCSSFGYTYSDKNGNYSFILPSGNYVISERILSQYPLAACESNEKKITVNPASACVQQIDFANSLHPIHDLHVSTISLNQPIPGFTFDQIIIASNEGTIEESKSSMQYINDVQLGSLNFVNTGVFNQGSNPNEYFAGPIKLSPGEKSIFNLQYSVPVNVPLGSMALISDTISKETDISQWINDNSPWNNVLSFTKTVVGSFDPNFVQVIPQGEGTEGTIQNDIKELEFTVHFENTGSYYARNIKVLSQLDNDLDWTSLQPLFSSHPCLIQLDETGLLTYRFDNIYLDYNNYSNGHQNEGYFTYSIKLKSHAKMGTKFTNSADIYFDYNAPVSTNTTLNTLGELTSSSDPNAEKIEFNLFPNPNDGNFQIIYYSPNNQIVRLELSNLTGRRLRYKEFEIDPGNNTLDLHEVLSTGFYFVTITDENGRRSKQKITVLNP